MKFEAAIAVCLLFAHSLFAEYEVFYANGKAGVRDDAGNILIPATHWVMVLAIMLAPVLLF